MATLEERLAALEAQAAAKAKPAKQSAADRKAATIAHLLAHTDWESLKDDPLYATLPLHMRRGGMIRLWSATPQGDAYFIANQDNCDHPLRKHKSYDDFNAMANWSEILNHADYMNLAAQEQEQLYQKHNT